jgi:hypothetical protein
VEFEIHADSFESAKARAFAEGRNGWPGFTEWELVWQYRYSDFRWDSKRQADGVYLRVWDLKVEVTSVEIRQKTYLPKLVPAPEMSAEDRSKWSAWLDALRQHERDHQRVSSVKDIETWLSRRAGHLHHVSKMLPADAQPTMADATSLIKEKLTDIWEHAADRIRDKNAELDQCFGHQAQAIEWDDFLRGYF